MRPLLIERGTVNASCWVVTAGLKMKFMSQDSPRRYKAAYAPSMAGEIAKNVKLAPGEVICYSRAVRERKNWFIAQPRMLAITPLKIILLEHDMFTADWILEIPRSSVEQVSRGESALTRWVNLSYSDGGGTRAVQIQPMLKHVSEEANHELFDVLNAFHKGQLPSTA